MDTFQPIEISMASAVTENKNSREPALEGVTAALILPSNSIIFENIISNIIDTHFWNGFFSVDNDDVEEVNQISAETESASHDNNVAEANDTEANNAEANDAEANDAEANDAEANDAEANNAEANDTENNDAEAVIVNSENLPRENRISHENASERQDEVPIGLTTDNSTTAAASSTILAQTTNDEIPMKTAESIENIPLQPSPSSKPVTNSLNEPMSLQDEERDTHVKKISKRKTSTRRLDTSPRPVAVRATTRRMTRNQAQRQVSPSPVAPATPTQHRVGSKTAGLRIEGTRTDRRSQSPPRKTKPRKKVI